jgi:hypothetical protein
MVGLEGFEPPTQVLGKQNRGEPRFFRPLLGADMGREAGRRRGSFRVAGDTPKNMVHHIRA